jgi:hypothetical protein
VAYLIEEHELSICKGCAAIGLSRATCYRPRVDWLERDRPLAEVLGALAEKKPGSGFGSSFAGFDDWVRLAPQEGLSCVLLAKAQFEAPHQQADSRP